MQVKVIAACEILQGPVESINVSANADIVRYSVDRQVLDFGEQVTCLTNSTLTFINFSFCTSILI